MTVCCSPTGHYQPVQFCQWVFGAAPGHPILARAIDLVIFRRVLFPASVYATFHPRQGCSPGTRDATQVHVDRMPRGSSEHSKRILFSRTCCWSLQHTQLQQHRDGLDTCSAYASCRFLSDRRWVNTSTYEPHPLRTTGPIVFSMAVEEFLDDRCGPHVLQLHRSPFKQPMTCCFVDQSSLKTGVGLDTGHAVAALHVQVPCLMAKPITTLSAVHVIALSAGNIPASSCTYEKSHASVCNDNLAACMQGGAAAADRQHQRAGRGGRRQDPGVPARARGCVERAPRAGLGDSSARRNLEERRQHVH